MHKLFETVKAHPLIFGAVALFVFVWFMFSGSSSNSGASDAATIANAIGATQQANAINAQTAAQKEIAKSQVDAAASVANAQTAASVQIAAFQAGVLNQQTAAALAARQSELTASQDVARLSVINTLASETFNTAAAAITENYTSQLIAAGADGTSSSSGSSSWLGGIFGGSTTATAANPAGAQNFNSANFSISELFDNLIRAVQGTAPLQTAVITTGTPTATTPTAATPETGTAADINSGGEGNDPIFVSLAPNKLPMITSVTPNASTEYGWSGSITDPNSGYYMSTSQAS